jgi:hypothetical protein
MMNIADEVQQVRCFGRFNAGRSTTFRPTNTAEVRDVFERARKSGQRITIRGGGHSFDAQALHDGDSGSQIILSTEHFEPERIEFDSKQRDRVTLGCGVRWRRFVKEAIQHARKNNAPIYLPGSIQTGGDATVGGTLAADCVSRSSGTMGKESRWIDSFRILTPNSDSPIDVSEASNPDLFHAVIGGHGYIGFVTDITYRLTRIDKNWTEKQNDIYQELCAHTAVSTHGSISELIQKHVQLIKSVPSYPRGVSAEWFGGSAADPGSIHGAVCDSSFAKPSIPKRWGFPLYHDLHSRLRYWTEVAVRYRFWNARIDWFLYLFAAIVRKFEDPLTIFCFLWMEIRRRERDLKNCTARNCFPSCSKPS